MHKAGCSVRSRMEPIHQLTSDKTPRCRAMGGRPVSSPSTIPMSP